MKNQSAFAYLLTFRTYGSWLHGDDRRSVTRVRNKMHLPKIAPNIKLHTKMKQSMSESEFVLNEMQRNTVLNSVIQTCRYNNWRLFAAHIRSNHVHIVLQSTVAKENTTGKLKIYATKDLKKYHAELSWRKIFWSRHGSMKNIWCEESIFPALYYVVRRQGEPMAVYYDNAYYDRFDEALYEAYFL